MTTGLFDDHAFSDFRSAERRIVLSRAHAVGARLVRFTIDWSLVAPPGDTKPPGFDPNRPDSAEYRWGYVDAFARDARRRGLAILFTVVRAPTWAEGADRPGDAPPGTWRPDPEELAAFMRASAVRYSGFFPDPQDHDAGQSVGRSLPAVRRWQVWDAPNSGRWLRAGRPGAGAATAAWYRQMLAESARALNDVDPENVVVTGGTVASPDPDGVPAQPFWRQLLCLDAELERDSACGPRAWFDSYAHDPVVAGKHPSYRGTAAEVTLDELGRLRRLVDVAWRAGAIRSSGMPPLWTTAFGWPTAPFGQPALSPERQARYFLLALHELVTRHRTPVVVWRGLRDYKAPPESHFPDITSGLYAPRVGSDPRADRARPVAAAFQFPFLVRRSRAWGVAPVSDANRIEIQRRRGPRWVTVKRLRSCARCEFETRLARGRGWFRAIAGETRSRPWRT